ncbi:PREDICTED: gamma-aminobutyric acid receptor-associated protein-like 1 isoform X2 [Hipposideros armiger]|uniref:Gamma-aminobutyric acid receptor-associated protein-like 1 isoform X2 n=1 Tax=Hipposideros armiger TaxID=186990 RepID=A0A8B7QCI8_HIPAR|nr:PREDICTED: gamma-aminobutyric acid receptor-associated protein-like 1 isoform X2 [Hipposideros armiger]
MTQQHSEAAEAGMCSSRGSSVRAGLGRDRTHAAFLRPQGRFSGDNGCSGLRPSIPGSPLIKWTLALVALALGGKGWEAKWVLVSCEDWELGWGGEWVPRDGTGPENKVTFSAQQPGCLILLGTGGVCGGSRPASGTSCLIRLYLGTIKKDGGLFPSPFGTPGYVIGSRVGSVEEPRRNIKVRSLWPSSQL